MIFNYINSAKFIMNNYKDDNILKNNIKFINI
jgi:hypothetical protein